MQRTSESGRTAEVARVNGREGDEISVLERGLHYGDGLFETIACLGGQPRFLERHLARLGGGCARLRIPLGDTAELGREVCELAAGTARAIVKVLVTRGAAVTRGYAPSGCEHATRITLRYAWPADDPLLAERGVRVRIATLRLGENPALAGLKHCNRLEQVLARAEWSDPDVSESLMFSSSAALVSGTMSNVFLVRDAALLTPRLDRCGVAGVMRAVVLAAAAAAGIAAEERLLAGDALAAADEIFLTSALIGIRPVRELQGVPLTVGPVTRRLQAALAPLLATAGASSAHAHA
ncbi:MAG TPA: aminodeoxychorismate lyase [Steroidobacteraceae bacterium]|nr:aminodeoxychorismate lyase [Steroidobacteraceae bacterium]